MKMETDYMKAGDEMDDQKVYIVCYRLKRKNARRKEEIRLKAETPAKAINQFKAWVEMKQMETSRSYELLTGDWKPVCFYKEGRCIAGSPEGGGDNG